VLQFLPHPEKSLVVTIDENNRRWDVINFHSVTGVGHMEKKGKQYSSLFNYLKAAGDHVVLCGDMNEPRSDSLNYEDIECWSRSPGNREAAESVIKGHNVHGMIDAHIEYISHIGGRSLVPTYRDGKDERRYYHIFVRGHKSIHDFKVLSVDPAISDHSIVHCEIELKDA
jgi:endonuclease/exonuclease/phosphatase family metal-dependent hydrolase